MTLDEEKYNRVIRRMAEQLGVSEEKVRERLGAKQFRDLALDSLDVQELILEFEEGRSERW